MVLVIYVINEDSGAGFEFFNIYVKAFTDAKEVEKPDTSHGNCGLDAHFNEITEKLQTGDKLVVIFDSVATNNGFNSFNLVKRIKNTCTKKGVELWLPNYYSFEELFLSSSKLMKLSRNPKYNEILKTLNAYLNGSEYDKNLPCDCVLRPMKDSFSNMNRETIYKDILSAVTSSIHLVDFTVSGEHLGRCWLLDCETIEAPNKKYTCPRCSYFTSDKLAQFEKDSLLRYNSIIKFLCDYEDIKSTSSMNSF